MSATVIDAVHAKLRADGLTAVQLEGLHRALPARGERDPHEINVAIAIARTYRDQLRPGYKLMTCRTLADELRQHVGSDGRYVAAYGQPLDMVSERTDVIVRELEQRHGCDFFELWEAAGGSIDRDADTDAYTQHTVAEVARRCESSDARYCAHNPQW